MGDVNRNLLNTHFVGCSGKAYPLGNVPIRGFSCEAVDGGEIRPAILCSNISSILCGPLKDAKESAELQAWILGVREGALPLGRK